MLSIVITICLYTFFFFDPTNLVFFFFMVLCVIRAGQYMRKAERRESTITRRLLQLHICAVQPQYITIPTSEYIYMPILMPQINIIACSKLTLGINTCAATMSIHRKTVWHTVGGQCRVIPVVYKYT